MMTFPGPFILVNDQITNPCDLMITELNDKITHLQTASAGISIIFMTEKEDCKDDLVTLTKNRKTPQKLYLILKKIGYF